MAANIPIKAIVFDLDETLWPLKDVMARAEQILFDHIEQSWPEIAKQHSIESLRQSRMEFASRHSNLMHDLTQLRHLHLCELINQFGYSTEDAWPAMELFLRERNKVIPYSDTNAALQKLASRFVLASLTNGNAAVEQTELAEYFSLNVSSRQAGVAKPSAGIYRYLCDRLGLPAAEVLHVGDNPVNDVLGARRAGMKTAWLNRDQRRWEHEEHPDMVVRDLLELPDMIKSRFFY